MKNLFVIFFVFGAIGLLASCNRSSGDQVDVLVVGGSTGGIAAGIQSARLGMRTLIIEETEWLGGMLTAAGVSAIDGNYRLPAGLWGEFRDSLVVRYGGLDSLKTGWVSNVLFEPSVGNAVFHNMAAKEQNLKVWKQIVFKDVVRENNHWVAQIQTPDGMMKTVYARILIDATELGDVAKLCGVKYDIGMESRHDTHEDVAPEKANHIVQDLTYVATLKEYGKDVSIPRPDGYRVEDFACCCNNPICSDPTGQNARWSKDMMMSYGKLPKGKYMINWPGNGNDYYLNVIEMNREERAKVLERAKQHTLCFLYFIQHELGFNTLGLADEYPTVDHLPLIPYYRESRRIHGLTRFTLNHVTDPYGQSEKLYRTNIAVGDYPVDHHHRAYQGDEVFPQLYFHPIPSFGLPLGTLIPQDVEGLIVAEKSISVSNIINGTTRLQPVVLQIGQAAGTLAALAVKKNKPLVDVSVRDVQNVLLETRGYLQPYLDVEVDDVLFKPLQRIGSTGIMRGVGLSKEWSNQTWFRADTLLLASELEGLKEIYPYVADYWVSRAQPMTIDEAIRLVADIAEKENIQGNVQEMAEVIWKDYQLGDFSLKNNILRKEMALLIDRVLDPFNRKPVDMKGALCIK